MTLARIERELGGTVEAVSTGPVGQVAALWTEHRFPMWYRVVVGSDHTSRLVLTPEHVRIWGRPQWSATGELTAGALDGIRRGVVVIDPADGTTAWRRPPAFAPAPDDHVQLVRWTHDGIELEGLLRLPPEITPPVPTVVFLHGGPVGALICGEHPDPSWWAPPGHAVFLPDFRTSGIAGRRTMMEAFERSGLPDEDPEAGDVLAGVDVLVSGGLADPDQLVLVGHSHGGYLANRIVARDHRFRVAVCCDGVADLRLLDPVSRRMQAGFLGGAADEVPERWAAASPVEQAARVRTPMRLLYAERGSLVPQGYAWQAALVAAGVDSTLAVLPGEDHGFRAPPTRRLLHSAVRDRPGG